MRVLTLAVVLLSALSGVGCKPEPKATREECRSITAKMAVLGLRDDKESEADIAETMKFFEAAIAEVHAGRQPKDLPPDFVKTIEEIEADCQKDFTSKDVACIRKAETTADMAACMLLGD